MSGPLMPPPLTVPQLLDGTSGGHQLSGVWGFSAMVSVEGVAEAGDDEAPHAAATSRRATADRAAADVRPQRVSQDARIHLLLNSEGVELCGTLRNDARATSCIKWWTAPSG
jgi:hypothetical protein